MKVILFLSIISIFSLHAFFPKNYGDCSPTSRNFNHITGYCTCPQGTTEKNGNCAPNVVGAACTSINDCKATQTCIGGFCINTTSTE